ncbi:MAG: hypothetical protein ACRDTQ_04630 [Micromonosporaceae bacterium]
MRRTIAGSVAALAAAAVVLTGCSGGSSVDDSQAAGGGSHADHPDGMVVQAYKNIEAESFRFTSTMKADDRTVSSTGAFDVAEKVGKTNVTMPHGQALKVRMLGEDMYMSGFMGDDGWIAFDLDRFPAGNFFGAVANPVANAEYLLAAADDVKEVSDGRYKGSLDLKKYVKKHATPEEAKRLEDALRGLDRDDMLMPFEAVVDDQGRLTQLKTTLKLQILEREMTIRHTSKFTDFGVAVDVKRPPASETRDASDDLYMN